MANEVTIEDRDTAEMWAISVWSISTIIARSAVRILLLLDRIEVGRIQRCRRASDAQKFVSLPALRFWHPDNRSGFRDGPIGQCNKILVRVPAAPNKESVPPPRFELCPPLFGDIPLDSLSEFTNTVKVGALAVQAHVPRLVVWPDHIFGQQESCVLDQPTHES